MNSKKWQSQEEHPSTGLLLLHLDGEIGEQEADLLRKHVDFCPACRARCVELNRGMSEFASIRDRILVPLPVSRLDALQQRVAKTELSSWSRLSSRIRTAFQNSGRGGLTLALGTASILSIAFFAFHLASPRQSAYASQILENARQASESLVTDSKGFKQQVRLRRGSFVIDRTVHRTGGQAFRVSDVGPGVQLKEGLDVAHIDWNDPLNARDFATWRQEQAVHTDSVKETSQDLTITTRMLGGSIAEGSLTLSRATLRPIARTVEFRNEAPIEIAEISYEISDLPEIPPSTTASAIPRSPGTEGNSPVAHESVSRIELETSELDLREAFHSIGADLKDSPDVWQSRDAVYFYVSPENSGQLAKIREAAHRIPHVTEASQVSDSSQLSGLDASVIAISPEQNLRSQQIASDLLVQLRGRSRRALAEAAALAHLAKRYSIDTVSKLPPDLQVRVNRLAASQLSMLQHDTASYIQSVTSVLNEVAPGQSMDSALQESDEVSGCLHWQESAALALPQVRNLDRDLAQLLASRQAEGTAVATDSKLLADSLREKEFLQQHLISTCQLFGAK